MRRIKILSGSLLFILPLLATQDDSQKEGAGGIVVGEGYAIALGAPPGWIFETKLALQRGASVVIYPADEGIDSTPVTIYVNVFALQGVSLEAWLTQDIAELEDEY
ncbi:hypothetical protein GF359_01365, partial [candidate division WOR-3 bacterium]|nr:hypothetical protein [candidate division WOR-3 bacterium]MBD3363844.1 hypothetical protein [candidate division WOR-3 bacterium]